MSTKTAPPPPSKPALSPASSPTPPPSPPSISPESRFERLPPNQKRYLLSIEKHLDLILSSHEAVFFYACEKWLSNYGYFSPRHDLSPERQLALHNALLPLICDPKTRRLTPKSVSILLHVFSINHVFLSTSLDTSAVSLLCRWYIPQFLETQIAPPSTGSAS